MEEGWWERRKTKGSVKERAEEEKWKMNEEIGKKRDEEIGKRMEEKRGGIQEEEERE